MQRRRNNDAAPAATRDSTAEVLERIARILAMTVVRSAKREEQVTFLHSVGYAPGEIASLLDVPANTVSVILYQRKKRSSAGKKRVKHN